MKEAGIEVSHSEKVKTPPHMTDLLGTHDKETSRQALTQGYKNASSRGWHPTDRNKGTFLHYEKDNGCAAMSDANFQARPAGLEPTHDWITITIICPDLTNP